MSKQLHQHKYVGALAQPIPRSRRGGVDDFEERVLALLDDCGVSESDEAMWFRVAMTLCERHVPGFRLSTTGRPKGFSNAFADMQFVMELDDLVRKRKWSLRSAAAHLAKKANKSGDALERRYRRIRDRRTANAALKVAHPAPASPDGRFFNALHRGEK